ncbi:hypothetical protein BAUCODRAFT_180239 [Baudoinia panamericana UAMH 10762]|uniref:Capsule synthesis protein CapA domain-containing protein n=1 Tax=Baudoinia panamericana (strain UAMH 10762) TaxID=717646 RepID=M2M0Y6_BAUPA|nr:uncharacterized protein BAUCODRAFT_180239 [Baudoinia panamericana UAMH 10762]EMD00688.1 hypothetical protein BAUCODRAFT_180239 [Baudoinia panamericana UAMH 10762]
MADQAFTLNFLGDVMLGRLIDQLFVHHVHEPEEARISPWGNTLPLLHEADLNLINLETAVTTHPTKWPNKVFNYRMHPANIATLQAARIHYATLANNHTLDFCEPGLWETVRTVKKAGLAFAGAGETSEEATRPAVLMLSGSKREYEVHVFAAADHPSDWAEVDSFHLIDYTKRTKERLKALITGPVSAKAALKVFSVHWGPNYAWQPDSRIQDLAHFLIDECGIDIVHGHSSHHVQGVEKYNSKLIIYGCGDFVDDYALVADYRNDLSGIWRVIVHETADGESLKLRRLEVFPTKIESFAARKLQASEPDAQWVLEKVRSLSAELATTVKSAADGRIVCDLT